MKKKVLMSLVLLALIGTSAVFAQQPTLDKLTFLKNNSAGYYAVQALDKNISGAVVIPDTYNNIPVTEVGSFGNCTGINSVTIPNSVTIIRSNAFRGCTGLTSITIPASITKLDTNAFSECNNLTSVTFQGSNTDMSASSATWPGGQTDLQTKYKAGGAGTYTRPAGSNNSWTKQGGGFSLSGTWTRSDGMKITIADNGQNITITGDKPNNEGKLNKTFTER